MPRERDFHHLDALLVREPGVPSTGMLKRVLSARGRQCQVCWRSRWFRAEVLQIYSTSLLCRWLDWPDHEWPHFFVRVKLANAPGVPPDMEDETWRVRWHESLSVSQLPIVQPKFGELPPLSWVKSFLRTYASADELSLVRELQVRAPRARALARSPAPRCPPTRPRPPSLDRLTFPRRLWRRGTPPPLATAAFCSARVAWARPRSSQPCAKGRPSSAASAHLPTWPAAWPARARHPSSGRQWARAAERPW